MLVLPVVAAAMVAAGCDRAPQRRGTTAAPAPAASPAASVSSTRADGAPTAVDAYRWMWKAYVEAIAIPDPAYPDLARYSQGNALTVWVRGLTSVQQQGLVGHGAVTLSPSVVSANPSATPPTVDINDCVDTSQTHLVHQDGSPYHDTVGGRRLARATVAKRPDGGWKVTEFALFGVGTC